MVRTIELEAATKHTDVPQLVAALLEALREDDVVVDAMRATDVSASAMQALTCAAISARHLQRNFTVKHETGSPFAKLAERLALNF